MCGATSGDEPRSMNYTMYYEAEVDYRREHLSREWQPNRVWQHARLLASRAVGGEARTSAPKTLPETLH